MGFLDYIKPYNAATGANPFTNYFDQHRGVLTSGFGGMVGAGNDPRDALRGFSQGLQAGQQQDTAYAEVQKADAEKQAAIQQQQDQQNATIKWLQSKGYDDLIASVKGGSSLAAAWQEGLSRANAKPPGPIKASPGDVFLDPTDYHTLASVTKPPDVQPGMQLNADGTQSPVPNGKEAFDREQALNQQYVTTDPVKTYQVVRNGYEKIRSASQAGTGPGDVSMIFAYMKMLDPTSVVREGEFATAQNAGGVGATISNLYNSVLNGQKLTPQLRKQFLAEADKMYKEASQNLTSENSLYSTRATPWGVDPSHFLVQPETYQPLASGVDDPLGIR